MTSNNIDLIANGFISYVTKDPNSYDGGIFNQNIFSNNYTPAIQTENLSAKFIYIDGKKAVAQEYIDNEINDLKTTILGTNLTDQLNQNLDTILEIDGFITDMSNNVATNTQNISNIQSVLSGYDTSFNAINSNVTSLNNTVNSYSSSISSLNTSVNNNTTSISNLSSSVSELQTSVNSINNNLTGLSYSNGTTTLNGNFQTNSIVDNGNLSVKGNTIIGNQSSDTLLVTGNATFNNDIIFSGLPLSTRLTNINNNITTLSTSKQDKSNTIYSNNYCVNAGVNKLSDVLTAIGTETSKSIQLSAGGINETNNTNVVTIDKTNLTIYAPDCAFNSPSTTVYFPVTLSSASSRVRISNVSFNENFVIDGSTGRHVFKACVFQKNFSLTNMTSNFLIFYYCSFSGQVNIPNTFAGYIIFYFCDFAGATLNFNNVSNQQIYLNSCVNLPSFSLNALLNGFNYTTTSSAVNTATLNVSGNVALPSNAISISNVNGLDTRLTTNETNTTNNTNSINTINTSITDIQTKNTSQDNSITSINSSITTINSTLSTKADDSSVVHKTNVNETIQGIKTFSTAPLIGTNTIATTNDITTAISNLVNGSPSTLDTLNELATALGNDPNFATTISNQIGLKADDTSVVHLSGTETITGQKTINNNLIIGSAYDINLKGSNLHTRLTNDEAVISNINAKTSRLSYDSGTNTTTINSKLNVQLDDQLKGNTIIGDASTDVLTVNATPTFNTDVTINSTKKLITNSILLAGTDLQTRINAKQDTLQLDTTPTSNSTNYLSSGSIFTTLSSYVTSSSLTSTLSSYVTSSSLTSTLSSYVTSSSLTSTLSSYITSSSLASTLSSYVTSSSLTSTLSSYLTSSTASSTYQTLSTSQTVTGNKVFNNQNTFSRVLENITQGTITTNVLTIDFSSNNSIIYVTPSANYTINITNLPSGTQTNSYTFTIYNNAKFYATALQVGGSGQTLVAVNGASNLATGINASATNLIQQVTLIYVNSTTPTKVLTSLGSVW